MQNFAIVSALELNIPSFPLCTVPRQCAVLCGVYTCMWGPLCLFMFGPCAGVLPPYKFTAFQAVNMYGGSALAYIPYIAYIPCTGIYIMRCLHEAFQPGLSSTRVRFQPAMCIK